MNKTEMVCPYKALNSVGKTHFIMSRTYIVIYNKRGQSKIHCELLSRGPSVIRKHREYSPKK